MASKRNLSSCSEPDTEYKKMNVQSTPGKISEDNFEDVEYKRSEAIENVKQNAPEWFAAVFDFMLKDLNRISEYSKVVDSCKIQCDQNSADVKILQKRVEELERKNSALEESLIRLESYSRKNNLIIKGITETGPNEDVNKLVATFMTHNLKMPNGNEIVLQAAHRIGKPPHLLPKPVKKPRDIIVKFLKLCDRESAWRLRFSLKSTPYILSEDFPSIIQEKRRKLLPIFQFARRHPDVNRCHLNGDVLTINGQRYTVDTLDTLPASFSPSHCVNPCDKRLEKLSGTAFFGSQSFLSNFHPSPFRDNGNTFPTVEHYYQFKKAMYFQDENTASAILRCGTPKQAKGLSYQIRDYDETLWKSVAKQTMYNACIKKFQQNPELSKKLKKTSGILVEANPKDNFFSCGLSLQDPDLEMRTRWKGLNILGDILIKVRESL